MKTEEAIKHVIKKSKEKPRDIFELNDGRIIVNGNIFSNRAEFDKILEAARIEIKVNNFFNKIRTFFGLKPL